MGVQSRLKRVCRQTAVYWAPTGVGETGQTTYDDPVEVLLWDGTAQLLGTWRNRLVMASDTHGRPALGADFATPFSGGPGGTTDALDWYGPWKWLDGLLACAFSGLDCAYAFGGTARQIAMGHWSDGHPVNPARLADGPRRARTWPAACSTTTRRTAWVIWWRPGRSRRTADRAVGRAVRAAHGGRPGARGSRPSDETRVQEAGGGGAVPPPGVGGVVLPPGDGGV